MTHLVEPTSCLPDVTFERSWNPIDILFVCVCGMKIISRSETLWMHAEIFWIWYMWMRISHLRPNDFSRSDYKETAIHSTSKPLMLVVDEYRDYLTVANSCHGVQQVILLNFSSCKYMKQPVHHCKIIKQPLPNNPPICDSEKNNHRPPWTSLSSALPKFLGRRIMFSSVPVWCSFYTVGCSVV